jgi:tetratricopeptide (TPR) repeat protein
MSIEFRLVVSLIFIIQINCVATSDISEENPQIISVTEDEIQKQTLAKAKADSIAEAQEREEELRNSLTKIYKDEMYAQYQDQANTLSNYYILAQQNLYVGDFENALLLINRAALIKENADVIALRGSIYLGLGYMEEFVNQWRKALEMDPDVPIPVIAYVIQQLQANGLIDENLNKAF